MSVSAYYLPNLRNYSTTELTCSARRHCFFFFPLNSVSSNSYFTNHFIHRSHCRCDTRGRWAHLEETPFDRVEAAAEATFTCQLCQRQKSLQTRFQGVRPPLHNSHQPQERSWWRHNGDPSSPRFTNVRRPTACSFLAIQVRFMSRRHNDMCSFRVSKQTQAICKTDEYGARLGNVSFSKGNYESVRAHKAAVRKASACVARTHKSQT